MIDMLTFSETLHPCSCAKERISGNLEFPSALETVMFGIHGKVGNLPCWVSPLVLQPIPYKKTARGMDSDMNHLDIGWFGILGFSFPSVVEITSANIAYHCIPLFIVFKQLLKQVLWMLDISMSSTINPILNSIAVVWVSNLPPTSMVFGEISIAVLDLHLYVPSQVSCSLWYTFIR